MWYYFWNINIKIKFMDEINTNIPVEELTWKVDDFDVGWDEETIIYMRECALLVDNLMKIRLGK